VDGGNEADDEVGDDDEDDDDLHSALLDMQRTASADEEPRLGLVSSPGYSSLQQKLYELTVHRDEGGGSESYIRLLKC